MVEIEEVGTEVLGRSIRRMELFFYANDSVIASTKNKCIQGAFAIIKFFLEQVGL